MKPPSHSLKSLKKEKLVKKASEEDTEVVRDEDIGSCVDLDGAFVHEGDLKLEGDLNLYDGATLIVRGNLVVGEAIATDETATLIVTGNVTCRHVYLEGNLEVQGNLTARGVIYGFYEAGMSRVLGKAKARIALLGNHDWECDDVDFKVSAEFSNYHELSEGDPEVLRKALGEKAYKGLKRMMGIDDKEEPEEKNNAAWGLKLLRDL